MRYFAYDLDGKMLGEYNATSPVHEFVWLGDMPVAVMTGSGPEPYSFPEEGMSMFIQVEHVDD
ncbi:hypothetical protein PV762_04185 [Mitsuaria sp. CC2]|uniref:hypothetical protein n=1 Tax=Mitsuaria sp. CC2 TaxID=3029186 RepID=UPI003B8C40B8